MLDFVAKLGDDNRKYFNHSCIWACCLKAQESHHFQLCPTPMCVQMRYLVTQGFAELKSQPVMGTVIIIPNNASVVGRK